MPFAIRDFQPTDFETLWRIDQGCFDPQISYSRAELSFYMHRPAAFTLVALDVPQKVNMKEVESVSSTGTPSSSIAGFIVAEANRKSGHIITIDVIAAARRFGVGSLLLSSAEGRLRAAHCRLVELETAVDNVSALSFYKRHSYNVTRTFPRYYSNGTDALVLEKDLENSVNRK